jgi:hypothetical protein
VVITNIFGSATSSVSTLTVLPPLLDSYAVTVLSNRPAGYWPLQETGTPVPANMETNYGSLGKPGTAYYATTNASNITFAQGGALAGSTDWAVAFQGSPTSYAFVPRVTPALTMKAPLTWEMWINSSSAAFADLMGEGGSGFDSVANSGNFAGIRMSWGGNNGGGPNLQAYLYTGSGTTYNALGTPANSTPFGAWHHCVVTYDSLNNLLLYVDGQLLASTNYAMAVDTWSPLTIGSGRWQGGPTRLYIGLEDEVAIYTNVLSAIQVTNHYLAGIRSSSNYMQTVLSDHPLLYYRMDDPAYTIPSPALYPVAINYGSAPVNGVYPPGTVPGGVSGPPVVALGTNSVASPINGIISCVDAGYDPSFNPTGTQPFTAAVWFKSYPSDGRMQAIMSHGLNWAMNLDGTTGHVVWNLNSAGSVTSTGILNDGNWHFVAGVYNGSTAYLYVDGALNNSGAAGALTSDPGDLFLGGNAAYTLIGNNEQYFAGAIAQAAFFTNALTLPPVQAIYQAATILLPVTITLATPGNSQMQLNWSYGTLQSATNVTGPYNDITNTFPPFIIPITNAQQFFRVREN